MHYDGTMTVPVTVVTGFLGAGKTTLLNAWLRDEPDAAVIVNELGAVGIDAELLRARAREIAEITGGCVCCTTYDELVSALRVVSATKPARIFVETSGAASPAGVVRAIVRGEADVALDGLVTVVDSSRVEALETNDLALEQIAYADVVVLSRPEARDARAWISARNPVAIAALADRGDVELHALLAHRSGELPRDVPSTVHDDGIESVALTGGEVDEERFGDFVESTLGAFAGRLLRVKGIVAVAGVDARMILQGVADTMEVSFGAPFEGERRTRVVLIGFGLDREAIGRAFAATQV